MFNHNAKGRCVCVPVLMTLPVQSTQEQYKTSSRCTDPSSYRIGRLIVIFLLPSFTFFALYSYQPFTSSLLQSYSSLDRVKNATSIDNGDIFVRAAIGYLPLEELNRFLPQAKWFLRSYQEMLKTEPPHYRTDIILVVERWHSLLQQLPCVNQSRISRNESGHCRIITGYTPLWKRDLDFERYKFADSISIVSFANDSNALRHYHWLLRTDLDVFLTPSFSNWRPETFVVGRGSFCFDVFDTCQRLERISRDMGLAPPNNDTVENIGSTWYGNTSSIVSCSDLTVQVMKYLHKHEFNETEKSVEYGIKGWPAWHHGVLTLYAGQIAINYCVNGNFVKRPDMLDFPASSEENVSEHAHLHTWHGHDPFSKFDFASGKYDEIKREELDLHIVKDYAMYMALDSKNLRES